MTVVFSREYPHIGSPKFWYRTNRWCLQHPYRWAAGGGLLWFILILVYFHGPITAAVGAVLLTAFGSWNLSRGFGRRNIERRIRAYEAKHGSS